MVEGLHFLILFGFEQAMTYVSDDFKISSYFTPLLGALAKGNFYSFLFLHLYTSSWLLYSISNVNVFENFHIPQF